MRFLNQTILTLFAIVSFSALSAQTTVLDTFNLDGYSRNYILHVPSVYDGSTAVPLVINMHGYGSNATQQSLYGNFKNLADVDNFLVVHPNGTLDNSGTRYWNAFVNSGAVDDVAFISALIDTLSSQYNIDSAQVFATGMSNGGFMSYKLACELSDRIAKIASVTGSMNTNLEVSCTPSKPIPVMQIHGTTDPTVLYNGSIGVMGIQDVVDYWVDKNNCDTTPTVIALPDVNTSDNSTVELFEYENGDDNSEVIFYKITNGGHTWPSALIDIPSGNTNKDFNASQVIWEFFKGSSFVGVGIQNPVLDTEFSVLRHGDFIIVDHPQANEIESVTIINSLGQSLLQGAEQKIDISMLSKGLYIAVVKTKEGYASKSFLK